jgi:predicted amidophosphoribosyltransferase
MNDAGKSLGRSEGKTPCPCPFCDAPLDKVYPFCKDCGKEVNRCKDCGKVIPAGEDTCEDCRP